MKIRITIETGTQGMETQAGLAFLLEELAASLHFPADPPPSGKRGLTDMYGNTVGFYETDGPHGGLTVSR